MSNPFQEEQETPDYENLASLVEDFIYRLRGCDDLTARKTLQSVYRDFCRKTCVLRTVRPIELEWHKNTYALYAITPDCVVESILEVDRNGTGIEFAYLPNGTIMIEDEFLPCKGRKSVVMVTCIEVPKIGSERATKGFINRYGDAIISGTLARLYSMQGRMWSDPAMATDEYRKYEYALSELRARHYGGHHSPGKMNFLKKGLVI